MSRVHGSTSRTLEGRVNWPIHQKLALSSDLYVVRREGTPPIPGGPEQRKSGVVTLVMFISPQN